MLGGFERRVVFHFAKKRYPLFEGRVEIGGVGRGPMKGRSRWVVFHQVATHRYPSFHCNLLPSRGFGGAGQDPWAGRPQTVNVFIMVELPMKTFF